jgi:choline monooxygenase
MISNTIDEILNRDTVAGLELPIAEARALPAKAYTCSDFFQLESARLFRGGWLGVAFSHDIPNPGDAMPLSVAGVEALVVRDAQRNVRAFHNVCRHRASTVLGAPAKGLKIFRCPYHCWSYDLDGRLVSAPMWEGPSGGKRGSLDADENALVPIKCGEWQDIVFMNISGDAPPLEEFVAPLEERWKGFDLLGSTAPFAHSERVIEANWKVVLEGFLEVYHEACLHRSLTYRVDREGRPTWVDITDGEVMGFVGVLPSAVENAPAPLLPRIPGMPATGPASTDIFLLFPTTSINMLEDHVVRTLWTPISVTETRWRSAWYFATDPSQSEAVRKTCEDIVAFWHEIRAEDLSALLRVQKGLSSMDSSAKPIRLSPYWEKIVRHFQRHIVRRLVQA